MTEPRKTPRTDAYYGFWATRYINGKTIFAFARDLEIETQELAEALEDAVSYVVWSDSEGRHPGDYPESAAIIAATRVKCEQALARHRAKQGGAT